MDGEHLGTPAVEGLLVHSTALKRVSNFLAQLSQATVPIGSDGHRPLLFTLASPGGFLKRELIYTQTLAGGSSMYF